MATRKVTTCDVPGCGKEGQHFAFSRGTRPSGAGDSDPVNRVFDLCHGHVSGLLMNVMDKLGWDVQDAVLTSLGVPLNRID